MAKARVGKSSASTGVDLPECPVCMEIMTTPIFQCQSGHSLCHLCTENLIPPNCPMCRQPMTQMRNWQLEELVNKAKVPCPNKPSGCVYIMMASEVQRHEKECIFRDMRCPHGLVFGRCSWSGNVVKILEHFKDKHPENCYIPLDSEVDIEHMTTKSDDRLMFLLNQGKFLFIFTIKIDTCQELVYFVVQHIGFKTYAQQMVYEIDLTSKQDNRRKAIFTDQCFSDSHDIDEIFSKGMCGIMPMNMLSNFIKDNTITIKITITKSLPNFKNKPTKKNNTNQTGNVSDNNKQPRKTTSNNNPNQRGNAANNNPNQRNAADNDQNKLKKITHKPNRKMFANNNN